jgi:hypothetical protein
MKNHTTNLPRMPAVDRLLLAAVVVLSPLAAPAQPAQQHRRTAGPRCAPSSTR